MHLCLPLLLVVISLYSRQVSATDESQFLRRNYEESFSELLVEIQQKSSTWKAGYNSYFRGRSIRDIKRLMGTQLLSPSGLAKLAYEFVKEDSSAHTVDLEADLPDSFDARTAWPKCSTIGQIRDQGDCGSCWAVAAAEVASDRTCVQSGGRVNKRLSAENIISCCWMCGLGCDGGQPLLAMLYWRFFGIVTGGPYGSSQGCQPYEVPPENSHHDRFGVHNGAPWFHMCHWKCEDGYNVTYSKDKHKAKSFYWLSRNEEKIRRDIMQNGPVEAAFTVYEDFLHYKTGVYQYATGGFLGGHAVKLFGWGVQNGTDYWLAANSWNTTWGDHGTFKIRRGQNECGIENLVVAGIADH